MSDVDMNALIEKRKKETAAWLAEAINMVTPLQASLNVGRKKYTGVDESDRLDYSENELGMTSELKSPTELVLSLRHERDLYNFPRDETRIDFEFARGSMPEGDQVKIIAYDGNRAVASTSLFPTEPLKFHMKVAEYVEHLKL